MKNSKLEKVNKTFLKSQKGFQSTSMLKKVQVRACFICLDLTHKNFDDGPERDVFICLLGLKGYAQGIIRAFLEQRASVSTLNPSQKRTYSWI